MSFNARREALTSRFAHHSLLKLDKSGKMQISPSRPWQANQRKKGQNWKKRTASDHTASQRSLTASGGLWCVFAPSRLGLQLAQSHHHPGLSLTGGAELQDGGGIARAEGLASKVQKRTTAPLKRSGIAEGP